MKASDFQYYSIQLSAFTTGLSFPIGLLTAKLFQKFGEIYSGDPIILPLPDNAPRDIPRLILKNKDESEKLQVSYARIDVTRQRTRADDILAIDEVIGHGKKVLDEYESVTGAIFGRLALVIIKTALLENPAPTMALHFCQEEFTKTKALRRPEVLEIHSYKRYLVTSIDTQVNSWIRSKAGRHQFSNGELFDGITVEQDINTPQEPAIMDVSDFNVDRRLSFYNAIPSEMQEILDLYYPGGTDG